MVPSAATFAPSRRAISLAKEAATLSAMAAAWIREVSGLSR